MKSNELIYTNHALIRMSQRGISNIDIARGLEQGTSYRKAGAIFIVMRQKKIRTKEEERLKNLTIVLTKDESRLLTVYKNKNSLKEIKRKSKKNLSQNWCQCGTT